MPSSLNADNGVVSGTAGLKSSADSSGVLDLQTNGTTAISISASQVVSFANQPTYTGGTANGVMFLNGSKAVTTGTALTFDGSQLDIPLGSAATPSLSTPTDPNTGMFFPAADTIAFAEGGVEAMRIDSSGNMGLGVTPSAWGSGRKILQMTNGAAFGDYSGFTGLSQNYYQDGSTDRYIANGFAARYLQGNGQHLWYTAPNNTSGANAGLSFTQAMTLDASGNFILGATSASGRARIVGAASTDCGLNIDTSTNNYASFININALNDNGAIYNYIRSTTSGGTEHWKISGGAATSTMAFSTGGSERARITSTGVLDLATGAGAVGQIQFPATQVASSNANTLDDYEEGTWTPQMYFGGTLATASGAVGRYVKIGRQVTVTGQYSLSSRNGGTGVCTLRSFPFSNTGTNEGDRGGAAVGYYNGFSSLYPFLMLDTGSTTATFRQGSGSDFTDANVGVGSSVWFSYSYITGS